MLVFSIGASGEGFNCFENLGGRFGIGMLFDATASCADNPEGLISSICSASGSSVASGVAVGGTGVAVGGTGVAVGGTGVGVGGTGVGVGGTGVAVGGTGVGVGGTGVAVGSGDEQATSKVPSIALMNTAIKSVLRSGLQLHFVSFWSRWNFKITI